MTIRILITGERDWKSQDAVDRALASALTYFSTQDVIVVHGDCLTGADHFAELWCNKNRVKTEKHPAQWKRADGSIDKGAGPRRNSEMVKLGANVCLAFWSGKSTGGTYDALTKAVRAAIPVKVIPKETKVNESKTGTEADLDELERIAKAATPGPWEDDGDGIGKPFGHEPWHQIVVGLETVGSPYMSHETLVLLEQDRAFIAAANPSTVLYLLAELRTLREAQRWIACSERMPAVGEKLAAWDGYTLESGVTWLNGGRLYLHERPNDIGYDMGLFTHWHALPALPDAPEGEL